MAISASAVLTAMQNRTKRTDITNIDVELKAILRDLSLSHPFLETSSQVTVAASGVSIAMPPLYRPPIKGVVINSSGVMLDEVPFSEYLQLKSCDATDGTPKNWAQHNDLLYMHASSATATLLDVFHALITENIATIAFPDEFQEAIIEGVCFKAYETRGLLGEVPTAQTHLELYREQVAKLIARYPDRV